MLNTSINKCFYTLFFMFLIGAISFSFAGECAECKEVAKGAIPEKFLDESVKELPSGIKIWDTKEAFAGLENAEAKTLWVDTRPSSFFKQGTIIKAILLVCDLKGKDIPAEDKDKAMSKEKLLAEMKKIDADINNVKVVFFCQGPECHRSYNAALRSVSDYGLDVSKIVWHRGGYPNFETHIKNDPKLNRRVTKYLSGTTIDE